jgi:hypothetical protein
MGDQSRDPKVYPKEGDWLTNGKMDVAIDGLAPGDTEVLVRRFVTGQFYVHSTARVPIEVYREHAKPAQVLAMGVPSGGE